MKIICPKCSAELDYKPRKSQQRKRKRCKHCNKNITVNLSCYKSVVDNKKQRAKEKQKLILNNFNLDELDKKIIKLIQKQKIPGELNQTKIAKILGKSQSTISRRLKKIENTNVIVSYFGDGIKSYQVTDIIKENNEEIRYMESHRNMVSCEILSNNLIVPEDLPGFRKRPMGGTKDKPHFFIKYFVLMDKKTGDAINITVYTKRIVFWPTAAGKTELEMKKNLESKILLVKDLLEGKLNCSLGFPMVRENVKQKTALCKGSLDSYMDRKKNLSTRRTKWEADNTPPWDSLEHDEAEAVEDLIYTVEKVDKIAPVLDETKIRVSELENKFSNYENVNEAFNNLKEIVIQNVIKNEDNHKEVTNEMKNLNINITNFVNQMSAILSNSSNINNNQNENSNFNPSNQNNNFYM